MEHHLFKKIDKFEKWSINYSPIPQHLRNGEWECDYNSWTEIYKALEDFIQIKNVKEWTNKEIDRINYIIARDNEMEDLATLISKYDEVLTRMTDFSIYSNEVNTKWQLATKLHKLIDREKALELLEKLIEDEDEYVNRRALIELAKLKSDKVESYCEQFWNRNKYGEMSEYQKIAVLHSLKMINSPKLTVYIDLAKRDGRKYLVLNASQLENTPSV